ncbi:MAG: LysE family translocator [Proteobacteria bacterium]|nr:LysE family translocator [Pseudomonadota bacterium]
MANVIALIVATSVLVLIPGPNVALIVANSLGRGLKSGLVTAFGTTVGIAVQLSLVIIGLATLVEAAASTLMWIRWLGVMYLIYLGILTWNKTGTDLAQSREQSGINTFSRGFVLAVINPKTLFFNAAFLPQFVAGSEGTTGQLILLAAVYMTVIIMGDTLWAIFAASARRLFNRFRHLQNRVTGGFLLGAAVGLALSRRS